MPTSIPTLAQAQADLALRLNDVSNVRFPLAELTLVIQEALRAWSSLTSYFRDQIVMGTTAGVAFYDLSTDPKRAMSVTDLTLVNEMEYKLLEPATVPWTGSAQFVLDDLTQALQRRRDQFLIETGLVTSRDASTTLNPVSGGRYSLPPATVDVRRVALTNNSTTLPLHRDDVWAFNHFESAWVQNPGRPPLVPWSYSIGETPPLVIQLVPPLSDSVTLDLVSVQRGPVLNPAGPVALGIPDDWSWLLMYGALADLLSKDGLSSDPDRAAFCEQWWTQGLQVAKKQAVIWAARVNDVPTQITAIQEEDQFNPLWQTISGQPNTVLTCGGSLLALSPVPDGVYSITIDVVRNAPVPVNPGDSLNLVPELYDTLLDYAEFSALFKEGQEMLNSNFTLLNRFLRAAGIEMNRQLARIPQRTLLAAQGRQDEKQEPREMESPPTRGRAPQAQGALP